jgi:fermentation-respiration switch protein FrsA (DUF1100 family)
MAHGLSGVKEHCLPLVAERFAAAGFVALAFDYRFFGDSEGEPRGQHFPLELVEDYRNAITWLSDEPEVDSQRIGIWGTSYSGGLVLWVGTHDKRAKAVVAQVPSAINPESRRAINPKTWNSVGEFLLQDRIQRYKTGIVKYMKVVSAEDEPCILPGKASYDEFMILQKIAPNWRNQLTLESLEKMREFDPVSLVHLMAPTALLLIPAENDGLIPLEAVKATYERAREPKGMTILPITHYQIYHEPWLSQASNEAISWYNKYL